MKRLQTFCCCASTRTGSIITACLGIILAIATIIMIWVVDRHNVSYRTFIFAEDFDKKLADMDSTYLNDDKIIFVKIKSRISIKQLTGLAWRTFDIPENQFIHLGDIYDTNAHVCLFASSFLLFSCFSILWKLQKYWLK